MPETKTALNWKVGPEPMSLTDLFIAIDRIIPEAEHQYLADLRATADAWYWAVGDTANRWYELVVANELPATRADVCAVISHKLDDERLGASSIELYARVAAFYSDPQVRARYEVLPTSHLRYAARFEGDWQRVLEYDLDQMDEHGGRVISLGRLRSYFEPKYNEQQAASVTAPSDYDRTPLPPISSAAVSRSGDLISSIEADAARLRNNLEALQRSNPRMATTIARIIALTNKVIEKARREERNAKRTTR